MASLPFFRPGFLTKTRETVCKDLTRLPWRYLFAGKNGKVFFWDAFVQQEKVPQKNKKMDGAKI